ncbi:hypothetical protein CYLTODRAFT_459655 [Cylindrobasidium torrendii FP15055 ss-10]|uniref:Uncharacterized protein n=1 Tax=Cylindrobasidium torrendii FP15055 ss-10 TaxID=1314674 RepID=A0A0D7AU24_9AGAR|nr:hypothetical protein CYLTODRAFT_459655 [Cylindrobasidium torrendii FP15055 ss-10]
MPAIYTEDCISFSPSFGTNFTHKLVESYEILAFRTHEAAAGMDIDEMCMWVDHPKNILHVASEEILRAFASSKMAFRPPPNIIALLHDLYEHNSKCPMSERRRFDEIPELEDCDYILQILPRFRDDIFLKHPVTGQVTMHQFPYGDMPRFRLLTANSSLVSVAAASFLCRLPSGLWINDPITLLSYLREAIIWPPRQQTTSTTKKIFHYPMTPPARKRKVQHDTLDSTPPLKRARKAPIPINHPEAAKTSSSSPVSSPDLRTSRKRKTDSDSDTPVTPPAKRFRTRLARATQPPPVAGKATAQLTCRPMRGAKTQAVARMAGVV